ncbi:hypothetical protein SEA_BAEHEXIC_8 [Mycobacterium phage Baehexic]|nr:hypothetical protein SEA_BAEHEXIC_8 [Mycobacterium phage Baehexic]
MSRVRFQVLGQTADYQQKSYVFETAALLTTVAGREQTATDIDYLVSLITDPGGYAHQVLVGVDIETPLPSGEVALETVFTYMRLPADDYTPLFDFVGPLEEA